MGEDPRLVQSRKSFYTGRAKVKTGCRTCKIRKVKCDEGRPACHRCISTGRTCDGYGVWGGGGNAYVSPSIDRKDYRASLSRYSPLPLPTISTEESGYLHWFRSRTAAKLPGIFCSTFWDTLVLQASLNEPAVLHAVLALSSIHKSRVVEINSPSRREHAPDNREQFMLRQYSKAISHLQPHFSVENKSSVRIALIACVMFICLEFLHGHYRTAQIHLNNGFKLLKNIQARSSTAGEDVLILKPTGELIDDWITEAFSRLHLLVALFNQSCQHTYLVLREFESELPVPIFKSINEARQLLDRLFNEIFLLTERGRQQKISNNVDYLPQSLRRKRRIQDGLRSWHDAYEASRPSLEAQMPIRNGVACKILHVYYTMAEIMASACLRSALESIFDVRMNDFVSIIIQSIDILQMTSSSLLYQTLLGHEHRRDLSGSITDLGWIPPLYYTALKCRNHRVRLQAVRLLGVTTHREGIWDAKISASVARKVMELEERDFYNDVSLADDFNLRSYPEKRDLSLTALPEEYRIQEVQVVLPDEATGNVTLLYKQRQDDGLWTVRKTEYDSICQSWGGT